MNPMEIKSIFSEYKSLDELIPKEVNLVKNAIESSKKAYAPYSTFKVGAALLLANNEIIQGNNQENAAYPSGLCAERIAVFYANAKYPDTTIITLAITARKNDKIIKHPFSPCGSCLQVLLETEKRFEQNIEIILYGSEKIIKASNVEQFLPLNFDRKSMKE
ncbi:MAG: cytidine deaminase [Bacteroidales bacterium]